MYKVIKAFTDLHDNDYPYSVGDMFPRLGIKVSEKRLKELSGSDNKQGTPLIKCQLSEELNPERLYDLNVWQYKYREGHLDKGDQRYGKTHIGLLAEDVKQHYPIAANYNKDGDVEDWSERYLIPPMLKLIQMQHAEIEAIKAELEEIRAS